MTEFTEEEIRQRLSGQRVMLIGGAGFIGHNLALDLRALGIEVMVVDNLMVNSLVAHQFATEHTPIQRAVYQTFLLERFRLMREAGIHMRNADARNYIDLSRLFEEFAPSRIVHLAAIASAVDANRDPGLCFDLQLVTLRNVLELCRTPHHFSRIQQVMILSSSTVYGDFDTPTVDENTRPKPEGIYANTKYMAERLVRTYCHNHGLGITIIRPSALYGERCISRRVSQVFIENALSGKPLLLEGGGNGRLDFTYICDLTDGMIRALTYHNGPGSSQTFNLTFGDARTILDLARVVKSVVPGTVFEERPPAVGKPVRGTLSTERAQKVLGFKARWTLEEGYGRYCAWYKEQWEQAARQIG